MNNTLPLSASNTNHSTRIETDFLGSVSLPNNVFYGIQTHRAYQNFQLSQQHLKDYPLFIKSLAMIKLAAARTNHFLKHISDEKARAIFSACELIIAGEYHDDFIVDMVQGGAGTSTNMNINEVIANIALTLMGYDCGQYDVIHPNNDINRCQSTNDVYPSAIKLAVNLNSILLAAELEKLQHSLASKGNEFSQIIKMGRTQLQDAVPMTVGQEFNGWAQSIRIELKKLSQELEPMRVVNLGGTAIGTGINASPGYATKVVEELNTISGIPFSRSENLIEAGSDTSGFVQVSAVLKRLAIKLSKIANDLRLLSMGPRAGINEINLPAMQAGSSIMPGKVNPVIPEAVNQMAYQIIGNDVTITMAAEAAQLQLNAMEPMIALKLFESMALLTQSITMLNEKCIQGITVNQAHCQAMVTNSIGIITAVNPYIGYENASRIARLALNNECSVIDLIISEGLMTKDELNEVLSPKKMVGV